MAIVHDGGPALPVPELPNGSKIDAQGLSLRDYFAAAALTGCLAAHAADGVPIPDAAVSGRRAYQMADAMLAARTAG